MTLKTFNVLSSATENTTVGPGCMCPSMCASRWCLVLAAGGYAQVLWCWLLVGPSRWCLVLAAGGHAQALWCWLLVVLAAGGCAQVLWCWLVVVLAAGG